MEECVLLTLESNGRILSKDKRVHLDVCFDIDLCNSIEVCNTDL